MAFTHWPWCKSRQILRLVAATPGNALDRALPMPESDYEASHLRLAKEKLSETTADLRNANARLRALLDLNLSLVSLRDPAQLLGECCRGARELIGARHALLAIRDPNNGATPRVVTSGFATDIAAAIASAAIDRSVLGSVLAERRALRTAVSGRRRRLTAMPRGYPPVRSLLAVPVLSPGAAYGFIVLTDKLGTDAFGADDEWLLSVLAALVGRGYENGTFYVKLQRNAADQLQTLSRRLVEAQESERRQLSRELHDRVGQNLTALGINLDILRTEGSRERAELRARLDDSISLVEATADAIENVMAELRPPMLDDHGVLLALQWYAKQFAQRTGVDVAVRGLEPAQRAGQEIEITLFRIAQEALNNVAKHARASRVEITLEHSTAEVLLLVADDGRGFQLRDLPGPGRGIPTMRERAEAVAGRFEVQATPGGGTRVITRIPLLP